MFYEVPLPSEEIEIANKLGLTSTDLLVENPNPMAMYHGRLFYPPIENAWKLWDNDSDVLSNIRAEIHNGFNSLAAAFFRADEKMTKISRDNRYSNEGRFEQMKAEFMALINSGLMRQTLVQVPKLYADLAKELDKLTRPPRLISSDAAGAIADSELRGVLRAKPKGERAADLRALASCDPESPLLIAALRSSPESLEIPREVFAEIRAGYGVATWPHDMAAIWTATAYLGSFAGLTYYGLAHLGGWISQDKGSFVKAVATIFDTDLRREMCANVIELVEAGKRLPIVLPTDREYDQWAQ